MKMKMKIKTGLLPIIILASVFISGSTVSCAALFAAALHELGHIAAAKLLSIDMSELKLGIFGASITTRHTFYSYKKEAALATAGPAVNLLSALLIFPACPAPNSALYFFALASLTLAVLNLLPIKGFDGGRILSSLLSLALSPKATATVLNILSFICLFSLWTLSLYLILRLSVSLSLFVFSVALFSKLFLGENN